MLNCYTVVFQIKSDLTNSTFSLLHIKTRYPKVDKECHHAPIPNSNLLRSNYFALL